MALGMQISGGQTVREEALLTVPPGYLQDSNLKEVGIILAHGGQFRRNKAERAAAGSSPVSHRPPFAGNDGEEWRGKLLTELAVALAKAGVGKCRGCSSVGISVLISYLWYQVVRSNFP